MFLRPGKTRHRQDKTRQEQTQLAVPTRFPGVRVRVRGSIDGAPAGRPAQPHLNTNTGPDRTGPLGPRSAGFIPPELLLFPRTHRLLLGVSVFPSCRVSAFPRPPGRMELCSAQLLLVAVLVLLPLLYEWSPSFRYYCKLGFFYGWILALAVLAVPICAARGRHVDNMKVLQFMLLHLKYLYRIRVEVTGWENFPQTGSYVVVSNHQSSLDLLGLMEVLPPRCVPVAKRELLYAGSAGLACWLAGVVFINRRKTDDAIEVLSDTAKGLLKEDVRVWIFPEGTRNHDGSMLPFKRGAFHLAVQAQVPIVPVVMSSYKDFYDKKQKKFNKGRCHVVILPPIQTCGLSADSVPQLTEDTREIMLSVFTRISQDTQHTPTDTQHATH